MRTRKHAAKDERAGAAPPLGDNCSAKSSPDCSPLGDNCSTKGSPDCSPLHCSRKGSPVCCPLGDHPATKSSSSCSHCSLSCSVFFAFGVGGERDSACVSTACFFFSELDANMDLPSCFISSAVCGRIVPVTCG